MGSWAYGLRFPAFVGVVVALAGCSGSKTSPTSDSFGDDQVTDQVPQDSRRSEPDGVLDQVPPGDVADSAEADSYVVPQMPYEAGFIDIEPVTYTIRNVGKEKEFSSSEARIWYIFQPADESPETRPLAVFFNGGPGSSTSLLFGFNTGRLTVDPRLTGGESRIDNPYSWTRFANLLYVDARQTGFSYNLMDDVHNRGLRNKEFETRNFNPLFDGADFVRVVLRFLASHEVLRANPVIIVGESYGGVRGSVMGYLLLNYSEMEEGTILYQDVALAQEIQAHFEAVWPEVAGQRVPREKIVQQFGHQVFVQPLLSGMNQTKVAGEMFEKPGSIIHQLASEVGLTYEGCSQLPEDQSCEPEYHAQGWVAEVAARDLYNVAEPAGWIDDISLVIDEQLERPEDLAQLLLTDPTTIDGLWSGNRKRGYRWGDIPETESTALGLAAGLPGGAEAFFAMPYPLRQRLKKPAAAGQAFAESVVDALEEVFGELYDWDEHYVSTHYMITTTFYTFDSLMMKMDPSADIYGELFLYDAAFQSMFITRAAKDIVIYAPAIPGALALHDTLVTSVEHVVEGDGPRPGEIRVVYRDGAFEGAEIPGEVRVRFPDYLLSGHPVEATEPQEFLEDVEAWYEATR